MPRKADLVNFLNKETKNHGDISLSELARKFQEKGFNISAQKVWRWVRNETDFPDTEDLEKLAAYKKLSLPDFLVIHLGYPKISAIAEIALAMKYLSLHELSEISVLLSSLMSDRISNLVEQQIKKEIEVQQYQGNEEGQDKITLSQEYLTALSHLLKSAVDFYGYTHSQTANAIELPNYIITALLSEPRGISLAKEVFWKLTLFINKAIANSQDCRVESMPLNATPVELLNLLLERQKASSTNNLLKTTP